jgi:hypothetical protein
MKLEERKKKDPLVQGFHDAIEQLYSEVCKRYGNLYSIRLPNPKVVRLAQGILSS